MANVKLNRPPLYIPSSGSIVRVKLRVSSGSGKSVFMVLGRESSERSASVGLEEAPTRQNILAKGNYLSGLEVVQR